MCDVLEVSRSGYYKWCKEKTRDKDHLKRRQALLSRISWHFADNKGRYGSPKITTLLRAEGWTVSERLVGLLMRENHMRACVSKKFRVMTTDSNHNSPIAPNVLNQNFKATAPNQVWMTDITYSTPS